MTCESWNIMTTIWLSKVMHIKFAILGECFIESLQECPSTFSCILSSGNSLLAIWKSYTIWLYHPHVKVIYIHSISQLQQHVICIVPGQRKACCWNDASCVDWQSRFVDRVPILPIDHWYQSKNEYVNTWIDSVTTYIRLEQPGPPLSQTCCMWSLERLL